MFHTVTHVLIINLFKTANQALRLGLRIACGSSKLTFACLNLSLEVLTLGCPTY